jgi:branched-chain amino acid transport system ATP-binding protein
MNKSALGSSPETAGGAEPNGSAPPNVGSLLEVGGVSKNFGGLTAVAEVSFDLRPGTTLGLIGPNGSGKTTLLNTINGIYPPDEGSIQFRGQPVGGLKPHRLAELGIMRTFQTTRVFNTVTVLGNMLVPLTHRKVHYSGASERAMHLLRFVGLEDFSDKPASELSGGQQKLLEFARALMSEPALVLMDEPFAGVHPQIKATLFDRIKETREDGTAFIVVSHEIPHLLGLSHRVMCMSSGRAIAIGTPEEVTRNPDVIDAYLGHHSHGESGEDV